VSVEISVIDRGRWGEAMFSRAKPHKNLKVINQNKQYDRSGHMPHVSTLSTITQYSLPSDESSFPLRIYFHDDDNLNYNVYPKLYYQKRSNMNWKPFIDSDATILSGKPHIKGTRLSVEFIIDLFSKGWTREQVLENYPTLNESSLNTDFRRPLIHN
jgi:uncharacterized protein (DUF433 family)